MGSHTTVSTFLLWGFSSSPDLPSLLLVLIFFSYVTILAANVFIMVAIKLSHNLHTSKYFFLCGLSFSEPCITMVIMLADLLSDSKTISLSECATQMFFFLGLSGNNCCIMAGMSYDHYTAIHNPLRYLILVTRKICLQLMMVSCIIGIVISLGIVLIVFNLPFCDSNTIQHFFCDIAPVVSLACEYTFCQKMVLLAFTTFVLVGTFILIMISYIFIVFVAMKMPSAKRKYVVFSTCSSHLTVVSIHHGFSCFVHLRPKGSNSFNEAMLMAVIYTWLTSLPGPIVYSLRNKEMQIALRKVLGNVIRVFPQMVDKREQNI